MARLLSVNVGLPRDIDWHGKVVHTSIWKQPVAGRRSVRRLGLEGDGQGDLAGHGGEPRAVFVYQLESYRYWEERLGRRDFSHGQFSENFTVEGLPDDEVCVGDRYRIGSAELEVTQPRVTCYRIGIRMDNPHMAALLTSSGRPGFYLRVVQEGDVGAGDAIVKIGEDAERMTIAEVNALLYFAEHPRKDLERALRIRALSPGWRSSFQSLLDAPNGATGNAGLTPPVAARPTARGFVPLRVSRIAPESAEVLSVSLVGSDGRALPTPLPGQFVVLRLRPRPDEPPLLRSYSLSGPPSADGYRVSVKIEPGSAAGAYLRDRLRAGDVLDVSAPRGAFVLEPGEGPVALVSAGIGSTPVLAMLHALAGSASGRPIFWIHGARNGRSHAFAREASELLSQLAHGQRHIVYSRPEATDRLGLDYDAAGHLDLATLEGLGVPREADFYLCGPPAFLQTLTKDLGAWGAPAARIHRELFAGGESKTPGVKTSSSPVPPHPPAGSAGTGPLVSFVRSGVAVRWAPAGYQSLLELAEACDVPVRWSCRTGVCHSCESGLVSGAVAYEDEPLAPPAEGNVLICCSRPLDDVAIDI
jgi:MOSC domain-containing protein YiiM/ferredoxin-NADP reductase